jgi:glutamine amidotransferase
VTTADHGRARGSPLPAVTLEPYTRGMPTIVDYGSGNLRSVQKAFEKLGHHATITSDPASVASAERLVLPGVGAFGDAMRELRARGLVEPIVAHLRADRPFFGICMGLQLLFETGLEGGRHAGLGVLPGAVVRFDLPAGHKVPHMGWNAVSWQGGWRPCQDGRHFYFVHAYHARPTDPAVIAATADYGGPFCAAVRRGNLFATQFHPEKSQTAGLELLGTWLHDT